MAAVQLNPIIGWAAIVSAAATLGTLITGILFFAVNEKFGKANDILSVVQVVFMLPVAMAMYRITRSGSSIRCFIRAPRCSWWDTWSGQPG